MARLLKHFAVFIALVALTACGEVSMVQKDSPANPYKDYKEQGSAIVGVGDPISKRQMRANATISLSGRQDLETVMRQVAGTYNVAVRWSPSVNRLHRKDILAKELSFNEARDYIEDVFEVQVIREGERRLLVLPSLNQQRIEEFSPGINVTLSQVVRGLSDICGFNLVIIENKEVLADTVVTTSLEDISCEDAFEAVLSPHGLSLWNKGDYYTIGGLPTRQWTLDLYEPNRTENQTVSYESSFSGEAEDGSTSESGGSGSINIEEERQLWTELQDNLEQLIERSCEEIKAAGRVPASSVLPPPNLAGNINQPQQNNQQQAQEGSGVETSCGYVRVNRTVGLVFMQAPQRVLEEADEIIRHVEDIASRRLLVEARILAVKRERGFNQAGSLVGGIGGGNAVTGGGFTPGINSIAAALRERITGLGTGGNKALGLESETLSGGIIGIQNRNLDAIVNLVEDFGTTYSLMQPTIEVMDRQRAVLIDGRNEKYFIIKTDIESTESGSITNTTAKQKVQFVGIQFGVSAQIAEAGEPHTVSLQIPITDIVGTVTVPDGSESQVPIASTRLIDQKVRIRDDEIKVIGGLTRTVAIDRESGVPLLRGVPAAGKLFNEENIAYENVEFVVLLKVKRLY